MQFHARVGVLPHERELPQLIEIDVSVESTRDGLLGGGSGVAGIDYREIHEIARESVVSTHSELLEQIADRIMSRVLQIPGALSARIAVRKPHVTMPGPLDYAEVVLERDAGS